MTAPWMALVLSLTALVLVLAVLVLGLMRRVVPVLEAESHEEPVASMPPPGLGVGETVGRFSAVERDGSVLDSAALLSEPRIFLFMSPSCQPCRVVAAELRGRPAGVEDLPLLVVMEDSTEARSFEMPAGIRVLFEADRAASDAFRSSSVPRAFAVDRGGVVLGSSPVRGPDDLRSLADLLQRGGDAALDRSVSVEG